MTKRSNGSSVLPKMKHMQVDCIIWHAAIEKAWVQGRMRQRQRLTALADELEQDDCLVSELEDTEE